MARAMPVLPLLHSRMMESGFSKPRCSASSKTCLARRSFTLPLGFLNSHLARIVTPSFSNGNDTSGVSPISESTARARSFFGDGSDMGRLFPGQNDLSRLAGKHRVESFLEFRVMKPMRDDGADVESALQHHRHFVPRLVHLASINAFDREHREDHGVPVNGHFLFGNAEHRDFSAMAHVRDHVDRK